MIKAIFFDFDGVIHDTFELNYQISLEFNPGLTRDKYKDFFNGNLYDFQEQILKKKFTKNDHDQFFDKLEVLYSSLRLEEKVKSGLISLKKKYKLFIISSNRESMIKSYFTNSESSLLFTEILGYNTHKSKVEKFKLILSNYHLLPSEVIFVTDTVGDVLEAKEVGVKAIAVTYGFHAQEHLQKANPEYFASSFDEVLKILNNY